MGIDTRWFGPSAWQLFHLIAFRSPHPEDVLNDMKDVLPCKFCRASTSEFVTKHPLKSDPGKWLYDIHNMVNHKLRVQCVDDPEVINPGPDPTFEKVKQMYADMKPLCVPGRDFLFAIAYNYPAKPEDDDRQIQLTFLRHLAPAYPFLKLAKVFQAYMRRKEPELSSRTTYMRWMYGLLKELSDSINADIPSYRGYAHRVAYYKSGCAKKTYKGKTCRKTAGGGRTKDRDHRRTFRVSHKSLL